MERKTYFEKFVSFGFSREVVVVWVGGWVGGRS